MQRLHFTWWHIPTVREDHFTFYVDSNKSKEDAIWSEALIATKSKEWSGFFQIGHCRLLLPGPFSLHIEIVKLGYGASCTLKYVPVRFRT